MELQTARRTVDPAVLLAVGGILAFVLGWARHSKLLRLGGLVAAVTGGGLYGHERLARRSEKIGAAENHIRSELSDLDPIARAQVLADIATSEL